MTDMLVAEFSGYGLMRIPTDPDPTDEPRGVSGFTFSFGNEPNLDRVIRLQPEAKFIRTHHPTPLGITINKAERRFADVTKDPVDLPEMVGAKMNWEDGPKLENRNWILTEAGKEPIIPFHMRIWKGDLKNPDFSIYRTQPINPGDTSEPVWKANANNLASMSANGMYTEPDTIGRATGMWNPLKRAIERYDALKKDLEAAQNELNGLLGSEFLNLVASRDQTLEEMRKVDEEAGSDSAGQEHLAALKSKLSAIQSEINALYKPLKEQHGAELERLDGEIAVIEGRMSELDIGIQDPSNRRITHAVNVERFSFGMDGGECKISGDQQKFFEGTLYDGKFGPNSDKQVQVKPSGWVISFWIGCWDPDTLSAYFEGTIQIPYA